MAKSKTQSAPPTPPKLTFAQRRLLERLIANPDCAAVITNTEVGQEVRFHGHFYKAPCRTCGHANREATSWLVIFALVEAGFLKPTMHGSDYHMASGITEAGHAALARARPAHV